MSDDPMIEVLELDPMPDVPVVYGRLRRRLGRGPLPVFMFKCPFCHDYHDHPAEDVGRCVPARCSRPTSPYLDTGYLLAAYEPRACRMCGSGPRS